MDFLAIPKEAPLSSIALAFETKGERDWDIPSWTKALKQASDYVLASVEPKLAAHAGKRIMATFVFPAPQWVPGGQFLADKRPADIAFLSGMAQMAAAHRVGFLTDQSMYKENPFVLRLGTNEVWLSSRGWRGDAWNMLAGKRQIGSQRFSILEELKVLDLTSE